MRALQGADRDSEHSVCLWGSHMPRGPFLSLCPPQVSLDHWVSAVVGWGLTGHKKDPDSECAPASVPGGSLNSQQSRGEHECLSELCQGAGATGPSTLSRSHIALHLTQPHQMSHVHIIHPHHTPMSHVHITHPCHTSTSHIHITCPRHTSTSHVHIAVHVTQQAP